MSTRSLALALLTIAASALTGCADITSPVRTSSVRPSTGASHDILCKTGTWSSSTGRCE